MLYFELLLRESERRAEPIRGGAGSAVGGACAQGAGSQGGGGDLLHSSSLGESGAAHGLQDGRDVPVQGRVRRRHRSLDEVGGVLSVERVLGQLVSVSDPVVPEHLSRGEALVRVHVEHLRH